MATKTLVAVFDDVHEAEDAVHALHGAGFARDDLGWVCAHRDEVDSGVAAVLIGLSAVSMRGFGPVQVAGPLRSALAGEAEPGGLIDALVNAGVPAEEARRQAERLRGGAAIVTVTVDDQDEEASAHAILRSADPPTRWARPSGERRASSAPGH